MGQEVLASSLSVTSAPSDPMGYPSLHEQPLLTLTPQSSPSLGP